jgi:hypothetical protein
VPIGAPVGTGKPTPRTSSEAHHDRGQITAYILSEATNPLRQPHQPYPYMDLQVAHLN